MNDKMFGIIKHVVIVAAALFIILGVPFLRSDYYKSMRDGTDTMTSATVVIDAPSGRFTVLINKALHPDQDNLQDWITFFGGGEIDFLFEDISCSIAKGDSSALDMAKSFQSRLPENQMKLQQEDATLLVSRVDNSMYDVVIMSKEYADSYNAEANVSEDTETIDLTWEGLK